MKQALRFLAVIGLLLSMMIPLFSCSPSEAIGAVSQNAKTLDTPNGLRIEGGSLCWNPVEYATRYTVSIDGKEFYSDDYRYPLDTLSDGTHQFRVKANGDGIVYVSSPFSEIYSVTIENGAVSVSDFYGQFDELTKKESFLGYGFDVINSSVFSDRYVKNGFRIFDTDELLKLRLVKVDSKQSFIDEVQSSSMEDFMASWNANANVNVKWGGKRIGGSVSVKTAYSGGVEDARSKYFHCISIQNQKFYIVMQGDMDTYRSILSDGFINDLYSDMEPAELFNRYGTHFITSAVMGGKINSYYLYTSSEEKSFHDASTKVSTEVRYCVGKTKVGVEGGYKQYADANNINIKNTLEVIGGGDYGMLSDADIGENYKAWENSLDDHAALIGIKDTSSLIPIWDLIDAARDTKTYTYSYDGKEATGSRSQQLQAYFMKYGFDSYNSLMKAADLPVIHAPEEISDVRINNQTSTDGEYEVLAGAQNDISFTVKPDNATGYTKTATISTACDWAQIVNEKGMLSILVSSDAPGDETIEIVLSAGSIRKIIRVVVRKQYTVSFVTNGGSMVSPIKNVMHGSQIDPPVSPSKNGYVFAGWYTDPNFAENSKYRFGYQSIESNLTLYAKWDVLTYKINYYDDSDHLYTTATVAWNECPTSPQDPKKTGYVFAGWYADIEHTAAFEFSKKLTADCSVWAMWQPESYQIIFEVNGGTAVPSITAFFGQKVTSPAIKKDGCSFGGWYRDPDFATLFDFSKDVITESMTLYAMWTTKPVVTVVFNCAGGNSVDDRVLESGAALGAGMPTCVREGYTFDGWFTEANGGTRVYGTDKITESRTLYAHWTANNYRITFDGCGGKVSVSNQIITYGESYGNLAEATRVGYTFAGWYYLDNRYTDGIWDIAEDITLTARWNINTYSVVLNTAGGTVKSGDVQEYTYGTGCVLPLSVEKEGYIFAGWYDGENGTGNFVTRLSDTDTGDKTLYAYWIQKKSYSAKINNATFSCTDETTSKMYSRTATLNLTVPEELKNMQATGHLRIMITVSGQANFQYRSNENNAAKASYDIRFGSGTYRNMGTVTAYGGGWPWTWVNPAYGDQKTRNLTASQSFVVNQVDVFRIQLSFTCSVSFEEYQNWAGGTHAVIMSADLGNISYQFYIE